jgi:hypothetical protein
MPPPYTCQVNCLMKYVLFAALALVLAMPAALQAQMVSSHSPSFTPSAPPPQKGTPDLFEPTGKPVARVNGKVLTDRDLMHELYVIFPYSKLHKGIPKSMASEMRRGALDMIIFDELVYQEALKRKMTIPDAKYEQAKERFLRQFPDKQTFDTFMAQECNNSPKVLRKKLERSLLIEAFIKKEVADKAKVTDAEVRQYYDKNAKKFEHNELFAFQSISIIPPSEAPDILKEAREHAEAALKASKTAKSYRAFGALAAQYSDDDYKTDMGDHKAVERSKLPPEVVKALLALKPGEVSGLIHLGNNYTILRLNNHVLAGKTSFREVKGKLRTDLERAKFERLRHELNEKLRKTSKVEEL